MGSYGIRTIGKEHWREGQKYPDSDYCISDEKLFGFYQVDGLMYVGCF